MSKRIWQDITERKLEQEALRQKTHDSGERVKELNCLYGIANLVEQQDISLEEILQGIMDLIPPSWQYPEITCARVIIHGTELRTKKFRETIWKQSSDIKVRGEQSGVLEVYYLKENPEIDEGPFLKEERNLINAIAGLTGRIVERKQAEESLRESAEKYRTLLETTSEGCWLLNSELETIEVNAALCKMLGYSQDEMLGKTPFDFVDDENRKVFIEQTSKISTTLHRSYEITLKKKKGQDLPTYFNATTIRNESGEVQGSFAFITDITEKKRMEVSLRQSESQKRAILDASIDRIRYIDKDMKIIWANKTTAMALNMSTEDLVGHTCYKLFVGRDTPCKVCPTVIARETGKIERAVMYQPKVKGIEGESYWDTYCVPLKNDAGEIESFIQIARNITDQKRAEEHINILTQELMRTQESERQRISRDLHDNVAQELSAVKIGCETLFDNQTNITPEIRKRMSQMSIMLQEIIKAIRDLSYYLRPSGLDEMGLIQTIFQYCHDFSEDNGINVDFHSAGMKDLTLDFDTEINLYRLIQEGLANIKKHADAEHVTIRLVAAFPNIILRIEDNGKGFDVQKRLATLSEEKRMGIRSMEQRAKLLQGEMEIQSKPMQGTKISIMLPYKDNKGDS
ncbi:MAG: PAS domain S-box protein [Deltaproteobacteria bacterium]|nr:PAS domain S-box protein [Deltaproteobacteria bacterium]